MSDTPKFKMVVRAVGNTKDEAWGNLNSVLCDACSSKYKQWEGQWPDYVETNDGRIECVTIVASTTTSNTPFTDQNEEYAKDCGSHELVVLAHKVRQIEDELTAAKQQLDEATKQRNGLRDALRVIVDHGGIGPQSMFDDARDELEAAKGGES